MALGKDEFSTGQAAKALRVSTRTIQRWDNSGFFVAKRTKTNRRYYLREQLAEFVRNHKMTEHSGRVTYSKL